MLSVKIQKELQQRQALHLQRTRYTIDQRQQNCIYIDGKRLVNFCNNDYLGLATNQEVIAALKNSADQFGVGSSASAMVAGYYSPHRQLEEAFAALVKRERALLFNSGYLANLAVLQCFADKQTQVIADKYCHASLIDAIRLSRAKCLRYLHNDLQHLTERLGACTSDDKMVVTEGVFSMQGDCVPVDQIAAIARENSAVLMVDDAHGLGVLGETGAGICEALNLSADDVPLLVSPLGKAMGSMGALVSGKHEWIEALLQFSRTYHYTTALPPALINATLTALNLLQREHWRRKQLQGLIRYFLQQAKRCNLILSSEQETPIKCVLIDDNHKVMQIKQKLIDKGFFVAAIRPPTVPENSARLRITLNCFHTERAITQLVQLIAEYSAC